MSNKISLKNLSAIKKILEEFKKQKTDEEIFYHLCFCICVPQTTFKKTLKVIETLKSIDFYKTDLTIQEIKPLIKETRFFNKKSLYLLEAKNNFKKILAILKQQIGTRLKRTILVNEIKGIGFKTASQLLRNLGADNLAIVDTHILKFMKIKDKNKYTYFEIENKFEKIALENKITIAEADALIWMNLSKTNSEIFKY